MQQNYFYDLVIIGAGPAGCSAALALSDSGLKVLLLDKDSFPRNKTCGDAVPGWAVKEMESVSIGLEQELKAQLTPHSFHSSSLLIPSGRKLSVKWTRPGYMIPRYLFDDFVLKKVIDKGRVEVLQECHINDVNIDSEGFANISSAGGRGFKARMVIGADGANSIVSKKLAGYKAAPNQIGSAVRCYYNGAYISDEKEALVFYDKKYPSGYFWIFPLGQGRVNVGFGMLHGRKRRINSRDAFHHFINNIPIVNSIMRDAAAEGNLAGGSLPFALKRRKLSGDCFLLAGDAASLVDPFSGDGITNAVKSGIMAARWAEGAIKDNQVNKNRLKSYDKKLYSKLWPELRQRARMMKLAAVFPGLVRLGVRIGSYPLVHRWLKSWI